MSGWKHYKPLWIWSGVVVIGAPLAGILITGYVRDTAGRAAVHEYFGVINGLAGALMGLGMLFPVMALCRTSSHKADSEPSNRLPPADALRRLYVATLERMQAELTEKRVDPLPPEFVDASPIGTYLQRALSTTLEMAPEQMAALVLVNQYGRSRHAFSLGKVLLPVVILIVIWIVSSVAMVFIPWKLLRPYSLISLLLVLLTYAWTELRSFRRTRAQFEQMAAVDLAVARVMGDPHQLVRALKMMEQHDTFPGISGRPVPNPISYRRRREHLEQALQTHK